MWCWQLPGVEQWLTPLDGACVCWLSTTHTFLICLACFSLIYVTSLCISLCPMPGMAYKVASAWRGLGLVAGLSVTIWVGGKSGGKRWEKGKLGSYKERAWQGRPEVRGLVWALQGSPVGRHIIAPSAYQVSQDSDWMGLSWSHGLQS